MLWISPCVHQKLFVWKHIVVAVLELWYAELLHEIIKVFTPTHYSFATTRHQSHQFYDKWATRCGYIWRYPMGVVTLIGIGRGWYLQTNLKTKIGCYCSEQEKRLQLGDAEISSCEVYFLRYITKVLMKNLNCWNLKKKTLKVCWAWRSPLSTKI